MCSMFAVTKNERKEHRIAVNARTEKFQHIEVFDKPALFTNGRIARDTVPKGWYCYDIRGSDDDPGELCYMEENVVVNHAGSVLMPEKLAMPKSGRLDVRDELGFLDEGDMTLREFCEAHQLPYPAENMKFHIRPARPEEAGLFYTPHSEEDKRLGTVGHVRMDFGRSGNEFWHTWWPRGPEELNSPTFKPELQEVVDTLRESVLKNRFAMERFCYEHGGKISSGWTQNYGYIVETEHYRYCLRCNPSPGDYNCYCTAYDLDVQRQNMARDKPLVGRVTYANGDAQEFTEFFKEDNPHYTELKNVLSDEEYASARESTLTAFYTPPVVIKAVYSALENMHFQTGNVLEPSCGIGNFMGLVPESMNDAKFYGVELDSISGRIAQQLYQKNSIAVQGFENTNLPDSFFDAAIGNVPFGQFKVPDKRYDKHNFLIHDYFFARTLDKVRPGGVIAFITSKGTLDKENPNVRKYIAQRADLLGAIRLPNDTFKAAAGTEVTSDIIFLQKRDRLVDIEPDWVHLATDANGIRMNAYFVDNPEMVLGDMQMVSGPHGMEPACIAYENAELGDLLRDAIQNIHAEITEFEIDDLEAEDEDLSIPADPDVRNFSFTVVDGKIYYRENSRMNPVDVSATAESRIKGMIAICDCVRTLIEYQTEDYPDADIKAEQEKLNRLYDDFSKKYGLISARANNSAFNSDSSYCLLASLEVLDDEGNFLRKADMFSKRTIKQKVTVQSVDTASEAYALSLAEKARIDMPYMSQLTAKTEQELFEDLKGVIFLNPMHISEEDGKPKYLPADEYLSGNVREKLRWAKRSAELYPEDYGENVRALEAVQPVDLTASEISVRLGATWLPPEIIEEFMFELFSTPRYCQWNIHVHYAQYTGEWNVEGKSYDRSNVKAHNTYGTGRVNGYKIMEETLNLRDVRIFDYIEDGNGRKTAVLNKKETAIAQGKQELIKQAFADWIWSEPERREQLTKLYNEKFNSIRPREYDGSHLNFVGINPEITLRPHQVNAIAHILYGGNTLLAHVVGAGKTFEMVAAAQESKRLGLCQKSLFVVPNHLTEQWASEYLQLYPSANILVATKKDFETKNRKKFCGRIATGDYDAVIIGHSQFEKIPMSLERQRAILQQQLDEVLDGISELKKNRGDNFSIKQLERTKKTVKQKLDKLNDQSRKDDVVTFEELGVDRIFIDEAHYYKNLAAFTKMRNVGGISQTEAMKSSDLYMKCRYLDELTGGRGVVFATGTPISNSMVEMYTMQKYLQYGALRRNDLLHFDAWASTFGETVTAIELSPEGYTFIGR